MKKSLFWMLPLIAILVSASTSFANGRPGDYEVTLTHLDAKGDPVPSPDATVNDKLLTLDAWYNSDIASGAFLSHHTFTANTDESGATTINWHKEWLFSHANGSADLCIKINGPFYCRDLTFSDGPEVAGTITDPKMWTAIQAPATAPMACLSHITPADDDGKNGKIAIICQDVPAPAPVPTPAVDPVPAKQ